MYDTLFAITAIFAIAATLLVVVTRRGLPVIPFFIVSGILAGFVIDETLLLDLAQWGIAFIVFVFGVNVDLEAVRSRGRTSVAVGLGQAAVVGGLGFAAGIALGLNLENAAFLAIAAGLSSSLVASSYLGDSGGQSSVSDRLATSIHFVEDLVGIVAIVALSAVVYASSPSWEPVAVAGGLLATALVVRYYLFERLTARIADDAELLMLVGITFAIGAMAVAEAVGLSIVVGAFAAGIAVADEYPQSLSLVDTIEDLEDFFAPIFFITLGALLTVPTFETVTYTLVLVLAILVINPLLVTALLVRRGYDGRTAISTGLALDHVSAFSLFVAIEAFGVGIIEPAVFDAIVLAAIVTMIAAAFTSTRASEIERTLRGYGLFERFGESVTTNVSDDASLSDHVVVAGSRYVSSELRNDAKQSGLRTVFVGDDPELIDGVPDSYVYGAVSNEDVWRRAHAEDARVIVSLFPDRDRTEAVIDAATDAPRIVRVDGPDQTDVWTDAGAIGVIDSSAVTAARLEELLGDVTTESAKANEPVTDDSVRSESE